MTARRYRFSLARVLALRVRTERDSAIDLARARSAEDAARTAHATAGDLHASARDRMLPAPGETRGVAELLNTAFLAEQLRAQTVVAGENVAALRRETAQRAAHLSDRVRDRRILERLRDREYAAWSVEDARKSRDEMDSIAQTRERITQLFSPESTR